MSLSFPFSLPNSLPLALPSSLPLPLSLAHTVLLLVLCAVLPVLSLRLWRRVSSPLARRVLRALRLGPTPRSIAFIMDGNRRWARARNAPAAAGHPRGGETLFNALRWCLDAGVRDVTVYAFSLENFKRPQEEVAEIFRLATEKLREILREMERGCEERVRVNVLGDLERLPAELSAVAAKVMRETRCFVDAPVLNICFAYTAREEMARAVSSVVALCDENRVAVDDVDEHLLAACLYTALVSGPGVDADGCCGRGGEAKSCETGMEVEVELESVNDGVDTLGEARKELEAEKDTTVRGGAHGMSAAINPVQFDTERFGYPDLLVRTSGEIRLSDFLLMQASASVLSFERVLWPDLSAWHMVAILLDYQAQVQMPAIQSLATSFALPKPSASFGSKRVQAAVRAATSEYYERLDTLASEPESRRT